MLFIFLACGPTTLKDNTNSISDFNDTSENNSFTDIEDDSGQDTLDSAEQEMWANSELIVVSPQPSSFYSLNDDAHFEAMIIDEAGDPIYFSEIEWTTSAENSWAEVGDVFDATLPVGQQVVTAKATLPNNDRLSYAIGGILVQHQNAGTYTGTTSIDLTINANDQSFVVSCAGAAIISVEETGEIGVGDGECILNINGSDISSTYLFDLILNEEIISGEAIVDLWLIQQGFPISGTIGDGELTASWADSVLGGYLDISGEINLERISLYPSETK